VLQWTGIPVSVGIAPTKTLAKLANRQAKKDPASGGVSILLTAEAQAAALARIDLTDLWGVAGRLAARLEALGIKTPLDLRNADPQFMRERFSVVMERMTLELRGTPCLTLEDAPPDKKSIMASRSFGRMVTDKRELEEAVSTHAARAAEKMRRQHLATARLVVFIHTNKFRPQDKQHFAEQTVNLPVATADSGKLTSAALRALNVIYRPGHSYKKAGVMLLDLLPAAQVQGGLFDKPDSAKSAARMVAIDTLNKRYGRDTVTLAASGRKRGWKLRSDFISPRYTTSWDELLVV
jgi:DNA polymerase V